MGRFRNPSLIERTEERIKYAKMVIDAFIPINGETEIWDIKSRLDALPDDAPEGCWTALQILNTVIDYQCRLVQACDHSASDLHPLSWHLALLLEALKSVVYVDIMPWQKQIAWHAAHRLAIALNKDLDRKPTTDVPPLGVVAAVPLPFSASALPLRASLAS